MTNKKEIVITGVNGFVGEHLARHLKDNGYAVHGVGREDTTNSLVAPLLDSYEKADLMDRPSTHALHLSGAVAIIHLAGLASVAESFKHPELYETGNALITDNLLSAAKEQGFTGRVVVISTGALYDPTRPMPINEDSAVVENSPYAVGKLRAEAVAKTYKENGVDVVVVRPFNHIGPHQGPGFLLPDLYQQLKDAKEQGSSVIKVGNLTTRRDYTDVRDVVAAYTLLATAETLQHDTYNVATGESHTGLEILDILKQCLNVTDIETIVDPDKIRPTDIKDIVGDASRLKNELGWQPASNIATAIKDFVANA